MDQEQAVCQKCFAYHGFPDQPLCGRCVFEQARIEANQLSCRPPSYRTSLQELEDNG